MIGQPDKDPKAEDAAGSRSVDQTDVAHKPKFLEGSIPGHIRQMGVPMGWGIMAIFASALVDAYFLGQLGTIYLAAITFVFPVTTLISNLIIGLGNGISSVISRTIGGSGVEAVRQQTLCAFLLTTLLVFLFAIIGFVTIDPLFTALGASAETLVLVRQYMEIFYATMIFLMILMIGNAVLRATGDARTAGLLMIGSSILNMILDPILIFGWFGLPRLEMVGAAYAMAIARVVTFAALIYFLIVRAKLMTLILPSISNTLRIWKEFFRIGGPLAASNVAGPAVLAVITGLLAKFGEPVVAGFGVAARLESLALIPFMAMSSGVSPIVGQNFGAGKTERIIQVISTAGRFSLFYGIGAGLFFLAFHRLLPQIFDSDPEVIQSAAWYLLVAPLGFTAIGVSMAIGAAYNGMGNPKPAVIFILGRTAVLFLPLAFLGAHFFGPLGVYLGGAIANLIVGVGAWRWVQHRRKLWIHRNAPSVM